MSTSANILVLAFKLLLTAGIIGLGFLVFVLMGSAGTKSNQPPRQNVRLVQVHEVSTYDQGFEFQTDGVVVPYREISVAAEVAGRVIQKSDNLRIGRIVQAGQPLVQLDRRDYELELERLQEELAQAEDNIAELGVQMESTQGQIRLAEQNLEILQRQRERTEKLIARSAATEASLDSALRDELTAKTSLQTQRDQLALMQAQRSRLQNARDRTQTQLAVAELQLSRTTITAPIDGVVVEDEIEQDSYLQKGAPICSIRDTSKLEIKSSLQAKQMKWLWESAATNSTQSSSLAYQLPETPVKVRFPLENEVYAWEGKLTRYDGGEVDQQTRMVPCRVQVEKPLDVRRISGSGEVDSPVHVPTLMVGMFVKVDVQVNPRTPLVEIPITALYPGSRLWVVKDDQLRRREVRIALVRDNSVLVYAAPGSIEPGEKIVVSPLAAPFDGAPVEVHQQP